MKIESLLFSDTVKYSTKDRKEIDKPSNQPAATRANHAQVSENDQTSGWSAGSLIAVIVFVLLVTAICVGAAKVYYSKQGNRQVK